ncbi:MAG: peptide MFS transporter [Pseudomonadota bacterium]
MTSTQTVDYESRAGGFRTAFFGHPRGVYLIAAVEVWERFSFYGMRGLLVLFLVAPVAAGGFGWSAGEALTFYGSYIALAYATPIVGGYIADHFTGPRRALIVGAILMSLGHFLMAGPVLFPWLLGVVSGQPLLKYLQDQSALPLGKLVLGSDELNLLQSTLEDAPAAFESISVNMLTLAYQSVGYSFYAATGLIILGTGFFKPNSYALLGRLYADDHPQRENGVFLFQIAVNLGAVFSGLIAGTVGEKFGWHLGFTVAGFGMLIGAVIFVSLQQRYVGSVPHTPPAKLYKTVSSEGTLTATERRRLWVIATMALFSALYWLAAEQYGGLINLYAQQSTDRMVAGFEIPATWFLSLNPFFIVTLTPLAMVLWSGVGRRVTPPGKFAYGFVMTAVGFLLMVLAFEEMAASTDQKSSALWLVGAYLFVTLGELCILSIGTNMVNTYAPLRMIGSVLAFWFLCTALGNYGSGLVGAMTESLPDGVIFAGIAVTCLLAAALLCIGTRWWSTLMHDNEIRTR